MTQNEIAEMVLKMKLHFGRGDGGGSNYFIDEYVLDELSGWITVKLTELLSNAEGEVEEHPVTLDGICPKCKAELQINGILQMPSQPTSKGESV